MSSIIVRVKDPEEGSVEQHRFRERSVVLGRARDCEIVLTDRKVSGHHAEVSFVKGKVRVRDLGSREGVYINGKRIEKRVSVTPEDLIEIGRFRIRVAARSRSERRASRDGARERSSKTRSRSAKSPSPPARRRKLTIDPFEDLEKSDLLRSEVEAAARQLAAEDDNDSGFEPDSHEELESSEDEAPPPRKRRKRPGRRAKRRAPPEDELSDEASEEEPEAIVSPEEDEESRELLDEGSRQEPEALDDEPEALDDEPEALDGEPEALDGEPGGAAPAPPRARSIWDEDAEFGYLLEFLSPVRDALLDPAVTEVLINGPEQIYIEREGRLIALPTSFPSDAALLSVAQNIAQSVGRPLDERNPIVDARLPDGSRVNCVVAPCARLGTCIAIRKFLPGRLTMETLLGFGAVTKHAADFVEACVRGSVNLIVTGGTGSGKTTLLNVVSDFVPEGERIIVIEDASELRLSQSHVLPMETRPADAKSGLGLVTIRDLLRASLRLRPDRIIVGELRGEEAFDLLQAFNTGHRGSMTTLHSNGPRDCLSRLEMLVTLANLDIPLRAIREQISAAVDVVVYTARMRDGSRKITHISEVGPLDDEGRYVVEDVFRFRHRGTGDGGEALGQLEPTGYVPGLMEHFVAEGMNFSKNFFDVYQDGERPT